MAIQDVINAIRDLIISWYQELMGAPKPSYGRYVKIAGIVVAIIGVIIGTFFVYRWYSSYREQGAQKVYMQLISEYNKAIKSNTNEDWSYVETLGGLNYNQYSRSYIAPYFLVLQAEAMFKQGKHEEALQVMNRSIHAISKSSPLFYLLQLKSALMRLDAPIMSLQQAGEQALVELSHDTHNTMRDAALFYLGRYYWASDKLEQARNAWQELVDSQWQEKIAPSPWVQEAQQKLKLLT